MVKTDSETYLARAVIIATGSKYKELGVPGEKELVRARRVLVCDL